MNTLTGAIEKTERFEHAAGPRTLASPDYKDEIAFRLRVVP
jgi:hypothetical protein